VAEVKFETKIEQYVKYQVTPDHKALGVKLKKAYNNDFRTKLTNLSAEEVSKFRKDGVVTVNEVVFGKEELSVKMTYRKEELPEYLELDGDGEVAVLLDIRQDEKLKQKGTAREIINIIQKLRKKTGLNVEDEIYIFIKVDESAKYIKATLESNSQFIGNAVKKPFLPYERFQEHFYVLARDQASYENESYEILLVQSQLVLHRENVEKKYGKEGVANIGKVLACLDFNETRDKLKKNGHLHFKLEGKDIELKHKEDIYVSFTEMN